jgi:serine/threonine protein kinase
MSTFCGTPEYIAPEMIQGKPYTKAVDWWSYGIVLFEMLSGVTPFYDQNANTMYRKVLNESVAFPDHFSKQARNLIRNLLHKDPNQRLGAGQADYEEIMKQHFFDAIDFELLMRKEIETGWKPTLNEEMDTANSHAGRTLLRG